MFKQSKHSQLFAISALLAVAGLILVACASQAAAAQANNTSTGAPAAASSGASNSAASAKGSVSFSKDLAPILQNMCVSCHGGERTSKALDLKTYASLMAGSQSGAMIKPGDAANSVLIQSIQSGKMPKRGSPLAADQIQLFVNWVNAGAQNN